MLFAGATPFQSLVDILNERDGGDSELCLFAMTLINKVCFHGILKFSVCFLLTIFMSFWLVPALFLLSRVQWSTTLLNFVVMVESQL